ncbi:hypothetical protein HDV00_004040 [Rhizophlyctis rosea]|nr:hypothetical protein HDV00_004040 [Rhizophlyctis rosea]
MQIEYHLPANHETWTEKQGFIVLGIAIAHSVFWLTFLILFLARRDKYAIRSTSVRLTVFGASAALFQNLVNFSAAGAYRIPCFLFLWGNYMGFAIIDSCIIARAVRLITKVTTGQTLVAKTRHFSIIGNFAPPASRLPDGQRDQPIDASLRHGEANDDAANRTRSNSASTYLSAVSSETVAVSEDAVPPTTMGVSPYPFPQPCTAASPAYTVTPVMSTTSLPLAPQSVNSTSQRTMSRRIWHAVLIFTFLAICVTMVMQHLSKSQRLWPVMDIGSCDPNLEFIPFYIWRGLMALLAPVLIWKLRNVNDAHGIRRDLILTAISTMTIDVMFAVSTTLSSKFAFWKAYFYSGYWVILHLTVIHFSSVIMPIIQSYRDDREREQNVNLDRNSFERVLRSPPLLEEFKQLAIADFCVESVLFLESYNALLHLLPPLMRPTTFPYLTTHQNNTFINPPHHRPQPFSTVVHPIPISLTPPTQAVPPHLIPYYLQFYSTFIQAGAPLEVNIPDRLRRKVGFMVEKGAFEVGMFGDLECEVREMLFRNTFFKFVKEGRRGTGGGVGGGVVGGGGGGVGYGGGGAYGVDQREGSGRERRRRKGVGMGIVVGTWLGKWKKHRYFRSHHHDHDNNNNNHGMTKLPSQPSSNVTFVTSKRWTWLSGTSAPQPGAVGRDAERGDGYGVDTLMILPRRRESLVGEVGESGGGVGAGGMVVQPASWGQISILELQSVGSDDGRVLGRR